MIVNKILSEQELKSIAGVLAETQSGLTKSELKSLLLQTKISLVDDGYRNNGYFYQTGLNKRDWLYNCFAGICSKDSNCDKIFLLIEATMNPVRYTSEASRPQYSHFERELNKILMLSGLQINKSGKLIAVQKADTLDEVDERVNHLYLELTKRTIHHQVKKYCKKDFLRKDYFDAVFEASKGLAERIREISGLRGDGGQLFQQAFSLKNPCLFFNTLQTDSEKSEFTGLGELLQSIFHLIRNPAAHTPKINWRIEEEKALDILTIISFAHKYLDECHPMPKSYSKNDNSA